MQECKFCSKLYRSKKPKRWLKCNHENNVPSRLLPQWLYGNSCTWAHDVYNISHIYLYIYIYIYIFIYIYNIFIYIIYMIYIYIYIYIHTRIYMYMYICMYTFIIYICIYIIIFDQQAFRSLRVHHYILWELISKGRCWRTRVLNCC